MDELPVVRAGSEASGPARLQHTVATEVAQGAVEHLWGRAHEWIGSIAWTGTSSCRSFCVKRIKGCIEIF